MFMCALSLDEVSDKPPHCIVSWRGLSQRFMSSDNRERKKSVRLLVRPRSETETSRSRSIYNDIELMLFCRCLLNTCMFLRVHHVRVVLFKFESWFVSLEDVSHYWRKGPLDCLPFRYWLRSDEREAILPNFKGENSAVEVYASHHIILLLEVRGKYFSHSFLSWRMCYIIGSRSHWVISLDLDWGRVKEKPYYPTLREITQLWKYLPQMVQWK